ncbi:unnamed protein product [Diamesa serratosioi]
MRTEKDPNILYGGDYKSCINQGCASLGELIISDLKKGEHKTAFIDGASDKSYKYSDLLEQSLIMAKAMHSFGIRQNDVVGIVSENRLEFPAIAFAAFYLGAIVTPINITYTNRELLHAFELSKPKYIFVSSYAAKRTIATAKKTNFVKNVVLLDGKTQDSLVISIQDLIKNGKNDAFNVEDHVSQHVDIYDKVALILCSSGTTGMPKGVEITQANMMECLSTYRSVFLLMRLIHQTPAITFNVAPWFHSLGFISMFMMACSHDSVYVFLPKFDEVAFLESVQTYKVNTIVVVPPIMVFLAKSPLVDKYDLSSIKEVACGAAALSKEVEDQVMAKFNGNITIRQGYGMSETTFGTLTSMTEIKPGSVGSPLKGVYAKIIDENGKSLGPNQNGELCFKGKRIMKGYINNPEATRETIDADGWLHSGDIGYYDDDFQFYIVDRLKELIKYKAFQVAPAEVEGILLSHPKIKDAGVIGIPDDECGELPFAYIVKQPGVQLTEKEVIKFVAENSSKAKRLHGGVRFIDEIPKNPSGKILRRVLRDLHKDTKIKSKL